MAPKQAWTLCWPPNEFFNPNTVLKHPLDPKVSFPLKASEDCYDKPLLDKLQCFSLTKAEYSTGKSITRVSKAAVDNAPFLEEVKLAPHMLDKLQEYAEATELNNDFPLPSPQEQSNAVSRLAGWFSTFQDYDRNTLEVGSEGHVQLNVYEQLIIPINAMLKLRYRSADIGGSRSGWRYGTEKLKQQMSSTSSSIRGGDSDFVLFLGAVGEIKTFWPVTEKEFYGIIV